MNRFAALLTLSFLLGFVSGCTVSDDTALHTLQGAGYTDIRLGDMAIMACGDDKLSKKFHARGPTGQAVEGVVCCGYVKNCTIRLD